MIPVTKYMNGVPYNQEFSDDEVERRMKEVLLRIGGKPATFDLETGQPFEGPQLDDDELRRRGYIEE